MIPEIPVIEAFGCISEQAALLILIGYFLVPIVLLTVYTISFFKSKIK